MMNTMFGVAAFAVAAAASAGSAAIRKTTAAQHSTPQADDRFGQNVMRGDPLSAELRRLSPARYHGAGLTAICEAVDVVRARSCTPPNPHSPSSTTQSTPTMYPFTAAGFAPVISKDSTGFP